MLKNKKRLTDRQSATIQRLCEINQSIYRAMLLKESFLQTYECANIEEAGKHLYEWIDQALFSGLESFFEFACSMLEKIHQHCGYLNPRRFQLKQE